MIGQPALFGKFPKPEMESNGQQITTFYWSLKPLTFCLGFVGIPINFSDKKLRRKVIILLIAFSIILANLIFNGPRVFEPGCLKWMEDIEKFESPYTYFKTNSFGIVKLVKIISNMLSTFTLFDHCRCISYGWGESNWSNIKNIFSFLINEMFF